MITRVFGKKIENYYDVDHKWEQIKDNNGDFKTVYTDKPTITKETKVKEWTELCSYEGEPRYNSNLVFRIYKTINISEYESVDIENQNNVCATIHTIYGSMTVRNIAGHEKEPYAGWLQVFSKEQRPRCKVYLDTYKMGNYPISAGDVINGEFELSFS